MRASQRDLGYSLSLRRGGLFLAVPCDWPIHSRIRGYLRKSSFVVISGILGWAFVVAWWWRAVAATWTAAAGALVDIAAYRGRRSAGPREVLQDETAV